MKKVELSIVIPTYNEKDNIKILINKILKIFQEKRINGEIIVVDDNSPDNTAEIVEKLRNRYKNLILIKRKGKLGLSSAVIDGFKIARGKILGVMDADLSHSPEKIPQMLAEIGKGTDFVIGSRYIKGGKIVGWGIRRLVMSKIAVLLSRLFTSVKDSMSGFFMIKKKCIENKELNPQGFKILLELIIKAKYKEIREIPIIFVNRTKGKSKAGLKEIFSYIQNLAGYLRYRKNVIYQFFKFAFVGLIGTLINILILYSLTEFFRVYYILSAIFAFIVAATSNFFLNKSFTFRERLSENILRKYIQFFAVSLTALLVNLFFLYIFTEFLRIYYIISQVIAICLAMAINFLGNKIFTFNK